MDNNDDGDDDDELGMWATYKTALLHFDYLHIALIVSGKTSRGASFPLHGSPLQILLYQQRGDKIIICSINSEVAISAWFKLSTWKQLITFDIHKKILPIAKTLLLLQIAKFSK